MLRVCISPIQILNCMCTNVACVCISPFCTQIIYVDIWCVRAGVGWGGIKDYEFCSSPNKFCSFSSEISKIHLRELTHSSVKYV